MRVSKLIIIPILLILFSCGEVKESDPIYVTYGLSGVDCTIYDIIYNDNMASSIRRYNVGNEWKYTFIAEHGNFLYFSIAAYESGCWPEYSFGAYISVNGKVVTHDTCNDPNICHWITLEWQVN